MILQDKQVKQFTYKDKFHRGTNLKAWAVYTIMREYLHYQIISEMIRRGHLLDNTDNLHFINFQRFT